MIAIHDRPGSFSDRWIEECSRRGLPFRRINGYDCDIIARLADCQAMMWHFCQELPADLLMARHVLMAAEIMGLKTFPDVATCWHFDDKVAQKYLLEAVQAPLIPTYVFYDRRTALEWIDHTTFPKVFKLRRGAGSINVRLVHSARQARRLVRIAFGKGFMPRAQLLTDAAHILTQARKAGQLLSKFKNIPSRIAYIHRGRAQAIREKGYIYFQDFIPGNTYDTRITIIGNRAFGYIRNVRANDFRASGSGMLDYDFKRINPVCVQIAFDIAGKIGAQSMAFDFVSDEAGQPRICEVSYGYVPSYVHACAGQWDRQGNWQPGHVWPQDAILDGLLSRLNL